MQSWLKINMGVVHVNHDMRVVKNIFYSVDSKQKSYFLQHILNYTMAVSMSGGKRFRTKVRVRYSKKNCACVWWGWRDWRGGSGLYL